MTKKKDHTGRTMRHFLGLPSSGVTNETRTGDRSRNGVEMKLRTEEERAESKRMS